MTTVAYIANQFPSSIEPYVMDEIGELRRRGVRVICCSGKRVRPGELGERELEFWNETRFFQPLSDSQLVRAVRRLGSEPQAYSLLLKPVLRELPASPRRRFRSLCHTLLGSALAEELAPLRVEHIHAHHGYFASWMAMVAARLLGIGFSFTLHGSDLLVRADLLDPKLRECRFCVTVSDFNRQHILHNFPSTQASKIIVQRLGVDPVTHTDAVRFIPKPEPRRFSVLSVGRLHAVKNHGFLIQACAALRDDGLDFVCWIVGEGPERPALERLIEELRLHDRVQLLGHLARTDLSGYYRYADLIALTSLSEGLPVVLMEAMAHEKLVIAPAITGIPELVEHGRTGFLYQPGSLTDSVGTVQWIFSHKSSLSAVERAAGEFVALNHDRQRNLRQFADQFLDRIAQPEPAYASSLLQQVQLPV
jgi:glycosyltransferase involved in cell wall biosynthesis